MPPKRRRRRLRARRAPAPASTETAERSSLVRVDTPDAASVARLQELGLDLTEHGRPGYLDVVLHGLEDGRRLAAAGFAYEILVPDLFAQSRRQMIADRRQARQGGAAALPSGRTTYRRLFDYSEDMKQLADDYPDQVRPITLAEQDLRGPAGRGDRDHQGRRLAGERREAGLPDDGRPPRPRVAVGRARDGVGLRAPQKSAAGKRRAKAPRPRTRTFVVPIVNPDGFNASREAGELAGAGGGRGGPDETANILSSPNEYRRKNCRLSDDAAAGSCSDIMATSLGLAEPGVDPNRNYGGFWGGPGASTDPTAQDYAARGRSPSPRPATSASCSRRTRSPA